MKAIILSLAILASACNIHASQQEPTKAELLATVRHIGAIAQQQQKDLDSEKAQHAITQKSLSDAQTVEIPALKKAISDQATELAASQAKVIAVEASRHKYVKFMWYSIGLNVLAGLWIFKKPIMMALGGLGGI